jgi:hypothetical protein
MATHRSDLEDHIATLEKFEILYEEFLDARQQIEGIAWGDAEQRWLDADTAWARRRRELQELAPQAEAAMVAAGARRWDEGPVRIDLPSRIFNFMENNMGFAGDEEQRKIIREIPTHIGGLKSKLRRAGDGEWAAKKTEIAASFGDLAERQYNDPYGFWGMTETQLVNWLAGDSTAPGYEHAKQVLEQKRRDAARSRRQLAEHRRRQERSGGTLEDRLRASMPDEPKRGRLAALWHEPNPWALVIVGGVIAALIAALALALIL